MLPNSTKQLICGTPLGVAPSIQISRLTPLYGIQRRRVHLKCHFSELGKFKWFPAARVVMSALGGHRFMPALLSEAACHALHERDL